MNNKTMSQIQTQAEEQINFEQTGLPIPESVLKLSLEKQTEVYNYLIQMSESQKKAYLIAKDHLGTSFNILKSNGFSEWKKSKN
jgi:competence protein ComGC